VFSSVRTGRKRPYLHQDFGLVKEDETQTYFLDKISEFISDIIDYETLKSVEDMDNFFDNYCDDCYMENSPWDVMIFRNGEWENMTPSFDKIWEHIQLLKLEEKKEEKYEEEKEEIINLTETDKEILAKLNDFFKELLNEMPLTPEIIENFKNMNQYQQFTFLFNNVTPKKYSENKELFHKFLNISIKLMKKDIENISEKLESKHDDELSEQLEQLLYVLSNAILVKQTFNI
jgi:hypothetical protein